MKKRRLLSILLSLAMMVSMLPVWTLTASATSGTVTFTGTDSTNIGQTLQDGTNSNDIAGIQLRFFNASSPENATSRIATGSFAFFTSDTIGHLNGGISSIDQTTGSENTLNEEHPLILIMYSLDGSAFSLKSVYINGDGTNQKQTKIEGFLNGVSTGFVTCTLDTDNSEYDKTFDVSNEDVLKNVDEIRITNLSTWTDGPYQTLPHGNWAYFNDFTIGDPIVSASSDAGLTSVLGQTITAGSEIGTSASPKTASINVANSVASISVSDIAKHDSGAMVNLYSDSGFSSEITGGNSISLTAGDATTVYVKVTAQDGTTKLHYAVTINRAAAAPSINLVANPNFIFDAATEGYTAQPFYSVRVQNTGTAATGTLNIALSGTNAEAFTLSKTTISDITASSENSFEVKYNTGLPAGTYTATVTVSGSNVTSKSFNVSFTVSPAGTTYTAQIRTYVDNSLADVAGGVDLRKDASVTTVPKTGTGIYEVAIPNGDYHIYVGGINTGRHLVVNNGNGNAEVKYYTVNFSATHSGTATGSSVSAAASGGPIIGGNAISSGSLVLEGKRVTIAASGAGAGGYTYVWSGSGTSSQTTAELIIPSLTGAVNAVCVITGSGALPADPDYKINGAGYSWSDGDETIALSGGSDYLEILKAPSHSVKIAIFSADGSTVTLDGNSVSCSNTYVAVYNDITLNFDELNITAPDNQPAVMLNKNDLDSGKAEICVTGVCTLNGGARQSGIYSTTDQDLTISGTGTLNTTGGNSPDSSGGGRGINMGAYSTAGQIGPGAKLTITGGVMVYATGGNAPSSAGGDGVAVTWGNIEIDGATLHAVSGTSSTNSAAIGIEASYPSADKTKGGNITIINSTVTATGDSNGPIFGGRGIYADNNLTIQNSDVTARGGGSTTNSGGIGIYANEGNIVILGGTVSATGGNGKTNGGHAVYSNLGTITVESGANLTAVGGNGETGVGGVGVRAPGYDGVTLYGRTVTISNNADNIYIRGGQGVAVKRDSVMGKDVYIGTGNIGSVKMEGSNPRSIKNATGGDNVYLVNVSTNPAAAVEIQCAVSGTLSGTYTYRAVADADGKACLWLPAGAQVLTSTGYTSANVMVVADDAANTAALSKPSTVTAHDSAELSAYIAAPYVTTINLVSGTEYNYTGTTVTRALTINGNGATITVGAGINDTIVKKEGNTVTGPVFFAIDGPSSSLTMNNVTLRDVSTRILAAINVKTGGMLLLDGVTFDGFFANKADDPAPTGSNMDGSHNNFGVHAEPGAVSTTVKNCTFGASNSFRNAVAIRNGTALIQNNMFAGTATPARQNQTDGFEYAVYLYGGSCTVTGNNISGYDSALTNLGYHSAAIATCPFYPLTATITGNNLHDNARGIDGVGAWHTYSEPARAQINGTTLDSSANAYTIGQSLQAANTFSGNTDGNISLSMDQNDYYVDVTSHVEYGPPAYYDALLYLTSTNSTGAVLNFDTGEWARAMVRNAKSGSLGIEVSQDDGATWTAASTTAPLTSSSTGATVNLTAGKTYLLRVALVITANTRPVGSTDDVSADIICYSNAVSATITSGGSGSSGGSAPGGQGGASVIVNGESKTAGTAQTSTAPDGKTTTTVTVDSTKLESILASEGNGATVVIPVTGKSDTATGVLTGEMVKGMERRDATLVIKTDSSTYTLPASEINITAVSQQLGTNVDLKDITVAVSIAEPSGQMSSVVENTAKDGGFTLMIPSVDYTVTCSYGGRTVSVSSFNAYIERTIAIPDGVDPSKITTGIVVNPDGTIHHVPTRITAINGKYYAVINSLTNSTYSVVWNPIEFSDVNNHWAKAAVNNMGSRMVVSGVGSGNYEPDRNMTRAEFAAVMVRALGLEPGKGTVSFGDVASNEWYCGYVKTAAAYDIIKGYSDSAFGPDDTITREQAMTMIARAMKITDLKAGLTDGEGGKLMEAYSDKATVSAYANTSIAECIKTGVVSGRGNNTIAPKAHVTRAEVAAMVERLLQKSNLI